MKNSKYYPWIVVGLLWIVALLNYLDRQMLSTLQSAMQLDITELAIAENFGRVMGIFLLIYGLMSPVAGMIADRINRKWLIVGSLFVWSAVTYGLGYAQTFQQVYWLRALMGVSEALYLPTALAMIADYHSSKTRSLAIGIHMLGLYTGQALGGFGATMAIAGGTRAGAGAFWADSKSAVLDAGERAATGANGDHVDHGQGQRPFADGAVLGETDLAALDEADIRRGAADIIGDDVFDAASGGRSAGADDAGRRTGQGGERRGDADLWCAGDAAIGLH